MGESYIRNEFEKSKKKTLITAGAHFANLQYLCTSEPLLQNDSRVRRPLLATSRLCSAQRHTPLVKIYKSAQRPPRISLSGIYENQCQI